MSEQAPTIVMVLAAGGGTRMRSKTMKVLHPLAGRTLLGHALHAARGIAPDHVVAVIGNQREQVAEHLAQVDPDVIQAMPQPRPLDPNNRPDPDADLRESPFFVPPPLRPREADGNAVCTSISSSASSGMLMLLPSAPPAVTAAPGQRHVVQPEWQIPLRLGGRTALLQGDVTWVPGPSPWPWVGLIVLLIGVTTAACLALCYLGMGAGRLLVGPRG